jgi:hypothetical protein
MSYLKYEKGQVSSRYTHTDTHVYTERERERERVTK